MEKTNNMDYVNGMSIINIIKLYNDELWDADIPITDKIDTLINNIDGDGDIMDLVKMIDVMTYRIHELVGIKSPS